MREIHFYASELDCSADQKCLHGWKETEDAVASDVEEIHTTQMGLMSLLLILYKNFRLFVHNVGQPVLEVHIEADNTWTSKEIRPAHNIFKMWEGGAVRY